MLWMPCHDYDFPTESITIMSPQDPRASFRKLPKSWAWLYSCFDQTVIVPLVFDFSQTSLCSYHYTSSPKSWPHNSPQNSCQVCRWCYFLGWGEQGNISLFQEPELLFFYAWGKRLSSHYMSTKTRPLQPECDPICRTCRFPLECHLLESERFWRRRQLDRHEQSRNNSPGTEGHQGRKPQVPSNGKS